MSIYDEMQGTVRDVMAEFKQGTISYVQITPGNGPVDNPGPSTQKKFPINGAANGVQAKYIASGLAIASDLQVVAPVDPLYVPDMKGSIEIDGTPYKIVQLMPKPPAGTPVAYLYIVRRGM